MALEAPANYELLVPFPLVVSSVSVVAGLELDTIVTLELTDYEVAREEVDELSEEDYYTRYFFFIDYF